MDSAPSAPRLSRHVVDSLSTHREQFLAADSYKHISTDGFFEPEFAEALLRDFQTFNPTLAKNEIYNWMSGPIQLRIRPGKPVRELTGRGWRRENSPAEATITVRIDDRTAAVAQVGHGIFEIPVCFDSEPAGDYGLTIHCDVEFSVAGDSRPLAYMPVELRHKH